MIMKKLSSIFLLVFFANLSSLFAFADIPNLRMIKTDNISATLDSVNKSINPLSKASSKDVADSTVLTIEGQNYINTETGLWWGVEIPRVLPTALTFRNNSITSVNSQNYMLLAGDEEPLATNNNLDGSVITGNKITWNGTTNNGLEAFQLGYNINQLVAYNYFDKTPYAVVFKSGNTSGNMTNTSGGFAWNIVKNSNIGVRIKGINGLQIYNNTFYDDMHNTLPGFIYSTSNPTNGNMPSTGTKIKNNIFYLKYNGTFIHIEPGDESGFECDYNIYYCEGGSPNFVYKGATKTWAQWQALGYDTHSQMINPNFIDTIQFVPTVRINNGTNLGSVWQSGLSTATDWIVGTSPSTTNQNGSWQVGAHIYAGKAPYYISPTGSDHNIGTIDSPWKTLTKALNYLTAGSTLYMRGGIYNFTSSTDISNKNGTADNLITIENYPGESPVIDGGSNINIDILALTNCSYLYFKGIRCTNLAQPHNPKSGYYGMILWSNVTHCTFELMETDHIGGWGIVLGDNCSDLLFLNCDSHHNADPYSNEAPSTGDPYGGSDGFETGSHGANASTNITFRGCRSWSNSDDGWDLRQADGVYTLDNCWSFWNGFIPDTWTTGGNGDGYKLGGKTSPPTNDILRTITHSLAFKNRGAGITPEPDDADLILGVAIYNCTAYGNGVNWGEGINTGNYNNYAIVRNCISYANVNSDVWMQSGSVHDHNNFDLPLSISDADFLSVSSTGVDGPRQADGSLPNVDFMKLSPTSDFIDAGVDVGLPFNGAAPDLGAFETGGVTGNAQLNSEDGTIDVYPNPVKDILNVSIKGAVKEMSLKLYDVRGTEVYNSTIAGDFKLDISKYQSGIYILKIGNGSELNTFKIIK